jgi:nucleotide-binding universal stress UspA family protein
MVAVRTGEVGPAMLELAREAACGLIVMGIDRRQPLSQVLFGSTVHHTLQHAPCPVLTVRPNTM